MEKIVSREEAKDLVRPLKKARKFVLYGTIPTDPIEIHLSAHNIILHRQVERLSAKVLEKKGKKTVDPKGSL